MYYTKGRILSVDDQEDMHQILALIFGKLGHDVVSVNNPLSALVLARNQGFDLFILDRFFTDGTGIDLCKRIRESDPSTPVIFFSADGTESARNESFKAGAQAYITKPDIDGLVSTVNALLDRKRSAASVSSPDGGVPTDGFERPKIYCPA